LTTLQQHLTIKHMETHNFQFVSSH